jgi:iron-sulfur cluster assembly accessory protein
MLQITPNAVQEIKRIQQSRQVPDSYLRLHVAQGGCLDLIYQFALETEPTDSDQQVNLHNINILIDSADRDYLEDLNIDYSEDLMGGGFRFTNPTADKTCNCGQSFQK